MMRITWTDSNGVETERGMDHRYGNRLIGHTGLHNQIKLMVANTGEFILIDGGGMVEIEAI